MKQDLRNVASVLPFVTLTGEVFNPDSVTIEQFTEFVSGLSKWVHDITYGLHQGLAIKGNIKALLKVYHKNTKDDTNIYTKAWKDAGLIIEPHEFAAHEAYRQALIKKKVTNVLYVPQEDAEKFYYLFCYKKDADVIDNIITVEATMGLRIIEALNPKVSTFKIVQDKVEQLGTAKMKKNKYVLSTDKVVPKTPIIITPDEFMKRLADVRADTKQYKDLSNVKMAEKYRENVNKRIVEYLREAKIPEHPELRSSHGLRRFLIAYAFAVRKEQNITLNHFIQTRLGHEDGKTTENYDTIVVTTDKFLEKHASAILNTTHNATIKLQEEIKNLEQKVDDLDISPAPVPPIG